jgi:hypothetical protein
MGQEMTTSERSFEVSGTARLSLRNVKGEIDIQPGAEGQITVTAVKHPGRGFDRTEIEITQAADGAVTAATKYEDDLVGRWLGLGGHDPCRVDYTVRLPAACELDVSFVSGPARVAGLNGRLRLRAVSGPLRLENLAGVLRIETVSGEVSGEGLHLSEPLDLKTVSGDVTLTNSRLPGADANTVSGAMRLDGGAAGKTYRFKSVSGNIYLRLPADARCAVSTHTLSGRLRSNLPTTRAANGGNGDADGALTRVSFNSVSGDLTLFAPEADGDAPPAEAASQPAGPRTAAERLELLERVSRGELSVDEALDSLGE